MGNGFVSLNHLNYEVVVEFKVGDMLKNIHNNKVCEIIAVDKKYYTIRKIRGFFMPGDVKYNIKDTPIRWRKLTKLELALA